MIIVTGGAGFIGSNIIQGLNARGETDILVVDDLSDGTKFTNIVDLQIADYLDKDDFLNRVEAGEDFGASALFHEGACSATTEWDGRFMMRNNYEYSKILLHYSLAHGVQYLYASSASVYGVGPVFTENVEYEQPLNVYGYSKFQFDQTVRCLPASSRSQVVGFRYFNVYGPREQHKGSMASVANHFDQQIRTEGLCRLFEGVDGYANGEQRRDFIYVEDAVAVNLWFFDHPGISGIFNLGTGRAQTFNDVARAVIAWHGHGKIEYILFPEYLRGRYQSFTQADISALRAVGYDAPFKTVEEGVRLYLDWLNR